MDLAERKARILYGQHLTNLADQKLVCRDLNGIQAQFLSAALHALDIRTAGPVESDKLVKSWTIRGTVTCSTRLICRCFSMRDGPITYGTWTK